MRKWSFIPLAASLLLTLTCAEVATADDMASIRVQLVAFVDELQHKRPRADGLTERVHAYVDRCPAICFGSTVTLLNDEGKAIASPYWYWSDRQLHFVDLMADHYRIDDQEWLTAPLRTGAAVWSDPYFDAGGGEVWMRTLSIPVIIDAKIVAIATTDLQVPPPTTASDQKH